MKKTLGIKELMVMGGALFSMHFGAACMLFPVQWGKDAGSALWPVFAGVLLSGVILPYSGYLALARGDGTFLELTRRLSPGFGTFFVALTIFVIGPLYMVPRMSAAAWAGIVQITGLETESMLPVILFSVVYYLITYWFVVNPGEVVNKIGKILFPILIVVVTAVIVKSLVSPISDVWAAPSFDQNPVIYGFLEGYATADLQCALLFGIIVIQGIRSAGIGEKDVNSSLVKIGFIGLGLLAVTILGHMIAGANTGGTIDLTLSALYTEMVRVLWGRAGGIIFNVALVTAALTTAVGAVSSTSEIWEEILTDKNPGLFTYADLDTIVKVIGPILDACYPPAIVIALYYCFCRNTGDKSNRTAAKWAVISSLIISVLQLIVRYSDMFGLGWDRFADMYNRLPLAGYSLSWLPVSILIYAIIKLILHGSSNHSKSVI